MYCVRYLIQILHLVCTDNCVVKIKGMETVNSQTVVRLAAAVQATDSTTLSSSGDSEMFLTIESQMPLFT